MNHMQMIFITSSFDMNWPPKVLNFLSTIAPLVEAQKAIVAFDCWMDKRKYEEIIPSTFEAPPDEWRITYKKLFIHAAMPIACGLASISVWYIILKRQGKITELKGKGIEILYTRFISTLVILLFLVHP